MKRHALATATFALLVSALLASPAASEVKAGEWRCTAPIEVAKAPAIAKGLVEVSLSPEALDNATASLADLRIVDARGVETPYVVTRTFNPARPRAEVAMIPAKLINRTYLPEKCSTVTADFVSKVPKDCVVVRAAGTNFRREVLIESSDDGTSWQRVREGALIFRVAGEGAEKGFERDRVAFPENDQRYLRVTVMNGAGDKGQVEIDSVARVIELQKDYQPGRTEPVTPLSVNVTQDEKRKCTHIELDLGFRNLPLDRMTLAFDDANFFRRATLEGRNEKTRVERLAREDGKYAEKVVEMPWEFCRSEMLFRYTAGGKEDSSTSISLDGIRRRYLRLTVHNEDNPPLAFRSAELRRFLALVRFPCQAAGRWTLYLGNPEASAPSYDLAHFADRLEKEGVVEATLGRVARNPAFLIETKGTSWLEGHPAIVWGALIAVGLALAVLIIRQAKSLKAQADAQGKSEPPKA